MTGSRGLTPLELELLTTAIQAHDAQLMRLVDQLGRVQLTSDEREALRFALAEELILNGLEADDEPNAYGLRLEDLIDSLGYL